VTIKSFYLYGRCNLHPIGQVQVYFALSKVLRFGGPVGSFNNFIAALGGRVECVDYHKSLILKLVI